MLDKSGRYLHFREWAKFYEGRDPDEIYSLAPDIEALFFESEPMWKAVFRVNGVLVGGESCITNPSAWATVTRKDEEFLNRLRTF